MSITQQILEHGNTLFDAVGITQLPDGANLLVLGLESRRDRDLDEFKLVNGRFRMPGYEKWVRPVLDQLVQYIKEQGFRASTLGYNGYPSAQQLYLKGEVIRSGLGERGKNTVILHPKFGPRLRFVAVISDAPLVPLGKPTMVEEENAVCDGCSICIDACPEKVLEPYRMKDSLRCLSDSNNMAVKNGFLIPCDLCLRMCPARGEMIDTLRSD